MSWSELERLVVSAERRRELRQALRNCRNGAELVITARRLGFRINRADLRLARQRHRQRIEPTPGNSATWRSQKRGQPDSAEHPALNLTLGSALR